MIIEWLKNERQKNLLEKEKLNTELALLKSQINPHFFFNTLNNICSLARKKSDDTELAIIKLSQLMRYNLYTSAIGKTELSDEVQYLRDYIDIQKMRLSNFVVVDFKVTGPLDQCKVEPLIFIPFVENAFKHGIGGYSKAEILIDLEVTQDEISFQVKNSLSDILVNEDEGGIGLKNAKRRLNLLYPDKHFISITRNPTSFLVKIKIDTHD
jgi:two-component system, LytTR family, sensor kinase